MNDQMSNAEFIQLFGCDRCAPCMIQGVFCHETGCERSGKTWNAEDEIWESDLSDDDYEDEWFEDDFEMIFDPE